MTARTRALLLAALLGGCDDGQTDPSRETPFTPFVPGQDAASSRDSGAAADAAGPSRPDASPSDDATPARDAADDASPPPADAGETPDAGPPPANTVAVSHPRELRAVWVATVFNINFPSRAGLSPEAQQAELTRMLDVMADLNLNVMMFQVRPECDALYASALEPWSRYLTGRQGTDPGYDPLAWLVEAAHARGIEVHAWLNPYRARASRNAELSPDHVARRLPQYARTYGDFLWMDPGAPAVQQHTLEVIRDLASRYDLDGIHFDDYFYPYPDGPFPDDDLFAEYQATGGPLDRGDWRRDNVNTLVREVAEAIRDIDPTIRFGISPFGIYRPGVPPGITGLDQYAAIFADPVKWIEEGWVDYLAPQLYWNATRPQQDYETLLRWWTGLSQDGRFIFAGNNLAQLGADAGWSVAEFRRQVGISRALRDAGSLGNVYFHIGPLLQDRASVNAMLHGDFYGRPALTPPVADLREVAVAVPRVTVEGARVRVRAGDERALRAWTVYRDQGGEWTLDRIVPAGTEAFELPAGRFAVAAAARHGVESRGVVIEVR